MFHIADLPHSPGVVYYHLLLRGETRNPVVAPFSFRMGIWDLFFVHRGQIYYQYIPAPHIIDIYLFFVHRGQIYYQYIPAPHIINIQANNHNIPRLY